MVNEDHIQTIFNNGNANLLIWSNGQYQIKDSYEIFDSDTRLVPIESIYLEHKNVIVPSGISNDNFIKLPLNLMEFISRNMLLKNEDCVSVVSFIIYTLFISIKFSYIT